MKLINIKKIYKTKNKNLEILKGINYEFKPGIFYAIIGHSGSGKTTLIKILGLMDTFSSGEYYIMNQKISTLEEEKLAYLRMKHIGFIFQDYNLDENLNAIDNIILPLLINKEIKCADRKNIAMNLLTKVGLKERTQHFPKELSGGEQQRVAIARALANNPQVILADEPTGNLDKESEEMILKSLKELAKKGKTVIVVTHSSEVKKYADQILLLDNGKLTKQ